ncbi:hypothetical protein STVIR_5451 [Streptomyces viridochromogenes Tue57]|uniref:Uncharacterized protein n=1 Tax=Streptomyces viridochromogenes Tue57 TaxID=1160705 RepID=L8P7E8_STRVR|nr:hypothetical protein STVIR_5451 [Streptomyces viridochromogenes Tue57]
MQCAFLHCRPGPFVGLGSGLDPPRTDGAERAGSARA